MQLFSLMAELFGHYFNDFIALRSIRRSGGTYEAEVRLWTIWISLPFFISGLVFFGFSLHKVLPWICICISWGFYQFALVTTTVAITGELRLGQISSPDLLNQLKRMLWISSPTIVSRRRPSLTCFEHLVASLSTTFKSIGRNQ